MSLTTLPAPDTLLAAPPATQTAVLDLLFEPSPPLHTLALPVLRGPTSFTTYADLIDAIKTHLLALHSSSLTSAVDRTQLEQILLSHPRLGAKKVESALSRAEQAQLQQVSGTAAQDNAAFERQKVQLAELNELYERQFPGLRYVVFVNGRGREEVMQDMREKIQGGASLEEEQKRAVEALCDIAKDRASKLYRNASD